MAKVLFLPEVREYFNALSKILYEKEYFGFEDSAIEYVTELFLTINTSLPKLSRKPSPKYFERYGKSMYYSTIRHSKHTQWYVFFNIYSQDDETVFLVRYISNNHMIAQLLV